MSTVRDRFSIHLLHGSVEVDLTLPEGWRVRYAVGSAEDLVACVARGLAGMPRFCNQTWQRISVAEHSVNLALVMVNEVQADRAGLYAPQLAMLHDAAEGLGVADINTFVKDAFGGDIRGFEQEMVYELWRRLMPPGTPPYYAAAGITEVHTFDKLLGDWEARQVGATPVDGSTRWTPPTGITLRHWPEDLAERTWSQMWQSLQTPFR